MDGSKDGEYPVWVKIIYFFGLPSAIAIYLVYYLVIGVSAGIVDIKEGTAKNDINIQYLIKQSGRQDIKMDVMNRLLQQICYNTAETADARNNCWR